MTNTLCKLWNEYWAEECAKIETEKEKMDLKRVIETHGILESSLSNEQKEKAEAYIEAVYEHQDELIKKAFFKGCEFGLSFLSKMI